MSLPGIVTAATTIAVAIALAIFVPVAQLRTIANKPACCCPDPEKCKCPEHKPFDPLETTMRSCHNSAPDLVQAQLPAFVAPALAVIAVLSQPAVIIASRLAGPHLAPTPRRPDAPS